MLSLASCFNLKDPPKLDGCPSISPAMLWGDQVKAVEELSRACLWLSAEAFSDATRHDNITTTFLMLPDFLISQISHT